MARGQRFLFALFRRGWSTRGGWWCFHGAAAAGKVSESRLTQRIVPAAIHQDLEKKRERGASSRRKNRITIEGDSDELEQEKGRQEKNPLIAPGAR